MTQPVTKEREAEIREFVSVPLKWHVSESSDVARADNYLKELLATIDDLRAVEHEYRVTITHILKNVREINHAINRVKYPDKPDKFLDATTVGLERYYIKIKEHVDAALNRIEQFENIKIERDELRAKYEALQDKLEIYKADVIVLKRQRDESRAYNSEWMEFGKRYQEENRKLRASKTTFKQLLQAALTYDPMIDCYKLKELHKRFKKALAQDDKDAK